MNTTIQPQQSTSRLQDHQTAAPETNNKQNKETNMNKNKAMKEAAVLLKEIDTIIHGDDRPAHVRERDLLFSLLTGQEGYKPKSKEEAILLKAVRKRTQNSMIFTRLWYSLTDLLPGLKRYWFAALEQHNGSVAARKPLSAAKMRSIQAAAMRRWNRLGARQ